MMGGASAAGSVVLGPEAEPGREENTWATPSLELWFSMFQALPGFYFLYFAFQCWRLNSGLHTQVSSTVHWVPDPALWKEFPPPSIISLLFPLVPPTQLQPETFGLFFYESIMSIPERNPYATPSLQDLPSRVLRDTPPHTPVPVNAPHLACQHSPLEEMPNHDYH